MVTNGCGEGDDLFTEAVCDGHSIIPPESIYELLGLQYTNYKLFTTIFSKRKDIGI